MKHMHPVFDKIESYDNEEEFKNWLDSVSDLNGRIIMESTALEDELELLLYEWLYNDSNSKYLLIILKKMNFYSKIDAVSEIAKNKLSDLAETKRNEGEVSLLDEWEELQKRMKDARISRNQVAHGSWLYSDKKKGVKVGEKFRNGDCQVIYRRFDQNELQQVLNNITWARSILFHFKNRLKNSLKEQDVQTSPTNPENMNGR